MKRATFLPRSRAFSGTAAAALSSSSSLLQRPPESLRRFENEFPVEKKVLVSKPEGFNFGGGPGTLRDIVKHQAAFEIIHGGLLDMSHREETSGVHDFLRSYDALIRDLLSIPKDYSLLFVPGGAHVQFSAVPLNLGENPRSASLLTGAWSKKSTQEQKKFAKILEFEPQKFSSESQILKDFQSAVSNENLDYVYLCTNETMQGIQLFSDDFLPNSSAKIVTDSTSDLFSRKVNVKNYDVIFASGGKNLGPAGFALVIVKNDIIANAKSSSHLPAMLSWKEFATSKPVPNIYNTPPLLTLGLSKIVLDDLARRGGVEAAEERNILLSSALYDEIDSSKGFYENNISKSLRSRVSVVFRIQDRKLESKFVQESEKRGLLQLVNHPSVGGMRASLYNGIPVEAVERLLSFMIEFREQND